MSTKVKYRHPGIGEKVREFSLEVHGEKFHELAQEFAVTNKGVILEEEIDESTLEKEPAAPVGSVGPSGVFSCDECEKTSPTKAGLSAHKRSHKKPDSEDGTGVED